MAWYRRFVALVVCASVLLVSGHARAESIGDNLEGKWPTEKKIVVLTLFGATLASSVYGIYALGQASSASARITEDFPRTAGDPHTADCTTAAQCADLRAAFDEKETWNDRVPYASAAMIGLFVAGFATAALWPNGNARLAPSATQQGGTLAVIGSF